MTRADDSPDILVLEEKHMIAILLYLLSHDGCRKTDIYGDISRGTRMPDKLESLESRGLVDMRVMGYNVVTVHLTDLGTEVAERLLGIRTLMTDTET